MYRPAGYYRTPGQDPGHRAPGQDRPTGHTALGRSRDDQLHRLSGQLQQQLDKQLDKQLDEQLDEGLGESDGRSHYNEDPGE